ncbi:AraC-type DNA-binding domain-containing protein [Hoeflea phototrophica DFL-43]|uniref:AraC-type DNA-binding domain-containing protein n=1 Tax=Hoeflea phototrophica (strain DSM 17068 / NCIMB 14078 / DFL-43) TaxID=411684 RepID=A9DAF9_HOEPD|nr:AraC family transcriptional regulator [Hoeflea phototrophica]EDQ32731.1 AraC-type DNA-binding domain-containing protein [Hoeflea phototrophica DFL-43]
MSTPDPNIAEMTDPLAETLHMLRLTGALYCRGELTAPWAVAIPKLDGVMTFMVVTSGACWLELEGHEPRFLRQGSLALIPHSTPHVLSSAKGLAGAPLFDLPVEKVSERYEVLRHGGGGELTRSMYGVVRFDDVAAEHLLKLLPEIIMIDSWDDQTGGWLQSTLRFIANEAITLKPGGETVITRLSDVVVIQAIRSWLETSPSADTGWLKALRDPQVGKTLALMHREPGHDWSVETLASRAGMSRSAFAARFSELVGETPLKYLTKWRMRVARNRLIDTSDALAVISNDLGYQSEASFCRAFKRVFGQPPGSIRRAEASRSGSILPASPAANAA